MTGQSYCTGCNRVIEPRRVIWPQAGAPYHLVVVFDPNWRDDPTAIHNTPDREVRCGPIVVSGE